MFERLRANSAEDLAIPADGRSVSNSDAGQFICCNLSEHCSLGNLRAVLVDPKFDSTRRALVRPCLANILRLGSTRLEASRGGPGLAGFEAVSAEFAVGVDRVLAAWGPTNFGMRSTNFGVWGGVAWNHFKRGSGPTALDSVSTWLGLGSIRSGVGSSLGRVRPRLAWAFGQLWARFDHA